MRKLLTALLLLIGTLGVVDIASARTPEELNKQCQKGNAPACVLLGIMYDNGEGVKQDSFKAAELYRQACDGKNALGCFNLGVAYELGEGVRQSNGDALTFYGKACDLKNELGCKNYARLKTGKR